MAVSQNGITTIFDLQHGYVHVRRGCFVLSPLPGPIAKARFGAIGRVEQDCCGGDRLLFFFGLLVSVHIETIRVGGGVGIGGGVGVSGVGAGGGRVTRVRIGRRRRTVGAGLAGRRCVVGAGGGVGGIRRGGGGGGGGGGGRVRAGTGGGSGGGAVQRSRVGCVGIVAVPVCIVRIVHIRRMQCPPAIVLSP